MKEKLAKSYLSAPQKHLLQKQQAAIPSKVRIAFEAAFSAWKDTWFGGGLPSVRTHTRERWGVNSTPLSRSGPRSCPW